MKKRFLVFSSLVMVLTGVQAQTGEPVKQESMFSVGIGGFAGGDLGGGAKTKINGYEVSANMGNFGGGFFVFFDAKYINASLGYFMGGGNWEMKTNIPGTANQKIGELSLNSINTGLLLKYPFVINSKLKLFPALGINYQTVLSAKLDDIEANHPDDLSGIWIQFGGGLDYSFTQKTYLRFEILYGLRTKNNMEEDYIDYMNYQFSGYSGVITEGIPGHGPNIKLALGFNL
jgi:hypothetical protein